MYKILRRETLSSNVVLMDVEAPMVAKKCLPGQFIILRVNEEGERIPLTIAHYDREKGVVTIIFQTVGATTMELAELKEGEYIHDFVGPLGNPSETEEFKGKKVAVIGGGLGCAIAWPQAKAIHEAGGTVHMIAGFRTKEIVMLENEMRASCDELFMMTDDGTYGEKGFVTNKLESLIEGGEKYDAVIAIGPLVMMKFVCVLTKKYNIPTIVSMNRHVRRLPPDCGRRDQVCLRGRPGLRRPQGGFRRDHPSFQNVFPAGSCCSGKARLQNGGYEQWQIRT